MRLNKLLTVALASMMMFSCSNNDEVDNGLSNGEKKAVILRLDGVSTPKTRSTDANTGSGDDDKKMSLSSIKVYFCNSTNIYDTRAYNSTDADTWANLVGTSAGASGHQEIVEVNAAVDRVIIVGNPDGTTFTDGITTVAALKGKVLSLSKENTPISAGETTKSNVTLYGTAPLIPVADGTATNYTHTAAVTIAPLISRIEVTGVSCTFQESEATAHRFNKVTVTGIGMVDYNNKMTIAGTASEPMTPYTTSNESGNIYKPDYNEEVTNGYKFCVANETWGWSFDIKEGEDNLSIVFETTSTATEATDPQHTFAYNFFVPETDPKFPNIMLVATVETPQSTSRAALPNKYVTTTDWGAVTLQRGYIYQFEYAFNENDLGEWDEKDIKKVLVTVTATPWQVQAVTPDFN